MPDSDAVSRSYRFKSRWRRGTRREVLQRDGGRCVFCGDPGSDGRGKGLTLAHIVPERLGGGCRADDVVLACRSCHGKIDGGRRYVR